METAARELLARHGRAAIEVAMTRATQAEKIGGSLHSAAAGAVRRGTAGVVSGMTGADFAVASAR